MSQAAHLPMMSRTPPTIDVDPYAIENLLDPLPFFDMLREAGPVAYIPKYGIYAVGRYSTAHAILHDVQTFSSAGGVGLSDIRKPGALRPASVITEVDPPNHTRVRGALTKVLSPIVVRRWKDRFEQEANEIVDTIDRHSEVDAVSDIIEPFVARAFLKELGVDFPVRDFLALGELNFNQLGPDNNLLRGSIEATRHIIPNFVKAYERESMLPGGFGEQIYLAEDRGDFDKGTAGLHVRTFLRAGVDTSIAGIGHTIKLFAENPDQWQRLKDDPRKAQAAFDEGLRLESPNTTSFRVTTGPTDIEGFAIPGDVKIGIFLGAANRDPRKFDDPNAFDIDRGSAGTHLALGAGIHICLGQMIARMEAVALISALVKRTSRIELAGGPVYRPVNALRTLDKLPLRLIETDDSSSE